MVMISGASSPLYASRRRRNVITMGLSFAATAFGLSWLVLILGELLLQGFSGLSLAVFTQMTPPPGSARGLPPPSRQTETSTAATMGAAGACKRPSSDAGRRETDVCRRESGERP